MSVKLIAHTLFSKLKSPSFFRSAIFANALICVGMVPQFLIVPLILRGWGETAYAEYIVFLACLNLFSQINGAMQNGFILRLMSEGKISAAHLASMAILNFLLFTPSILLIISDYYWDLGVIGKELTLFVTICVFILFFFNSLKIILQVASSVVAPLFVSLVQSLVTLAVIFGLLFFGYEADYSLIVVSSLVYVFLLLFCAIWVFRVVSAAGLVRNLSIRSGVQSMRFILNFGILSFLVSLISNLFNNGSKVYLGNTFDASLLVDFNLSLTLCMVAGQFISPVFGLIFPHLAKSSLTSEKRLEWIVNAHRVFWMLAMFIYLAYLFFVDELIRLWLGSEYLHLGNLALQFLMFVFLKDAASPGVQLLKVNDQQSYTLVSSVVAFIITPLILIYIYPINSAKDAIAIFVPCGGIFYCLISLLILRRYKFMSSQSRDYFLGVLMCGLPIIGLYAFQDLFLDDYVMQVFALFGLIFYSAIITVLYPFKLHSS